MNVYVGTSGYAYKEWKGSFYPSDLPASAMLKVYGERLRAVEINSSFYWMPKSSALKEWAEQVPAAFRFALKAPQQITHFQRLKGSRESVALFLDVAATLKDRLGPLLFQLPPNMKQDLPRLREFLALLPARVRVAVEFRHPSWFENSVMEMLRDHGAALCIADADDGLEVPPVATAGWGYIRLRRPDYGAASLKKWAALIARQKWKDAFVFFKHEDEGKGPKLAKKLVALTRQ